MRGMRNYMGCTKRISTTGFESINNDTFLCRMRLVIRGSESLALTWKMMVVMSANF
jgi:hypothetical protein